MMLNTMCKLTAICVAAFAATSASAAEGAKPLGLVEAFEGRTVAYGTFISGIAGVKRTFTATLSGRKTDAGFTLAEKFVFADGERDRKTWRFVKTSPGHWSGTREDVIGTADVVEDGPVIRLNYVALVKGSAGSFPLAFSDTVYRGKNGSIINTATVSAIGLPVAKVALRIVR